MAAFTGYRNDVFVSYAQVDDKTVQAGKDGWVTTLKRHLDVRLTQLVGRDDSFEIWMDLDLERYGEFGPKIIKKLEQSATLLVVLSPGYLASEWCQRELQTFAQLVKERDVIPNLFVVKRDVVGDELPPEIASVLGHKFWEENGGGPHILSQWGLAEQDPTYFTYCQRVEELARDLKRELNRLKKPRGPSEPTPSPKETRPQVFIAEATRDLEADRDKLCSYLDTYGYQVLPAERYSSKLEEFQAAVQRDMRSAVAFIRLLSGSVGEKPLGSDRSYAALQRQCAVDLGKAIFQWRSPTLNVEEVEDRAQRELLEGVLGVEFDEFKRDCLEQIKREVDAQAPSTLADGSVFINCLRADRSDAQMLADALGELGCLAVLPIAEGTPFEVRKNLKDNLLARERMVLFYGAAPANWVSEQLQLCWRDLRGRDDPIRALGVYYAPPHEPTPLGVALPKINVMQIDGRGNVSEQLKSFLQAQERDAPTVEPNQAS